MYSTQSTVQYTVYMYRNSIAFVHTCNVSESSSSLCASLIKAGLKKRSQKTNRKSLMRRTLRIATIRKLWRIGRATMRTRAASRA